MGLSDSTAALNIVVGSRNESKPGLQSAEQDVNHFAGALEKAKGPSMALLGLGTATGAALGFLGVKAIGAAADMEQTRIAFATMLGSGQKADAFIKDLQHFAATTPFEFVGLQDASKRLLAMGFDAKEIIPTMTSVGNAVAALGSGQAGIDNITYALGQMKTAGKVHTQDLMQLTNAGIGAWDMLAKHLHMTVSQAQDAVQRGTVTSKQGLDAIMEGMNTRYAGLMEKQSHTVTGVMSNIQDAVGQTMTIVGNMLINGFDLKGKLGGIQEFLSGFQQALGAGNFGEFLYHWFAPELIDPMLDDLERALGNVKTAISTLAGIVASAMAPVITAFRRFAEDNPALVIAAVGGAIFGLLVPAIIALGGAMLGAVIAMAPFFIAGAALGALAFLIARNWGTIYPAIKPILDALGELAVSVFQNVIKPAVMALVWVFQNVLVPVVGATVGFIRRHWDDISGIIVAAVHVISSLLKGDWGGAFNAVKEYFGRIVHLITHIFDGIHIPLPHFSAHGSANPADWLKGQTPGIDVAWYGSGGSFLATSPRLIGVGDRPEWVNISPLGSRGGPQGGDLVVFNIEINGNVDSKDRVQELGVEFERRRRLYGGRTRTN